MHAVHRIVVGGFAQKIDPLGKDVDLKKYDMFFVGTTYRLYDSAITLL